VLEYPVCARRWAIQASCSAVAGTFDAVLEEEIDGGYNSCHVDAGVVADAATFAGWSLEVWEALLGDPAAADGEVVVAVSGRKDIEIAVGVIVLLAHLEI